MALDRQDIERRDFPIGRRGYEPAAVDGHLRAIAAEVEQLQQSRRGPETLATAASEQVRAIVEAAETSAAGIQREAEEEARSIREQAQAEAERSRSDAASQARAHVERVSEATSVMLQRVDAMEGELGALVESLRTGANRLTADLTLLQGNMGELREANEGAGAPRTGSLPAFDEPEPEPAPEPAFEDELGTVDSEAEAAEVEAADEPLAEPEPAEAETAPAGADSEGARLIALNMALNGTSREETDRYLAENFDLDDRAGLLDEVYSRVG